MRPTSINTFPGGTPSGTIVWNGESIDCLGICNGQSINKILYIIAEKVCDLTDPYDLSTLTLQCALDLFKTKEPATRTIANIIQLSLDNGCGLKELIDNLQEQIDGISEDNFIINLKCLAEKDSFGNALSYTRDSVMQLLVSEVCSLTSEYDGLSGKVIDLQDQLDIFLNQPKVIEENSITTCIATNKPVSQSVVLLSTDYCNYKGNVGQSTQIQSALALQPSDFNTKYATEAGWVTMPTSMAQELGNVLIVLKNHEARIAANESCCASTCDDVKVGYEVLVSDDGKYVSLRFSTASGMFLPNGWTDKGSSITITDSKGSILSYNTEISQDGTTDSLSLGGLDTTKAVLISMTAIVGTDIISCTKCVASKSFSVSSACPVCLVTATGTSGEVTIIYQ